MKIISLLQTKRQTWTVVIKTGKSSHCYGLKDSLRQWSLKQENDLTVTDAKTDLDSSHSRLLYYLIGEIKIRISHQDRKMISQLLTKRHEE